MEGRVAHPLDLSLADLIESPTTNSKPFWSAPATQPAASAVSNAVWEGVPISHLLREAGAAPDAAGVLLEGADSGRLMPESPHRRTARLCRSRNASGPKAWSHSNERSFSAAAGTGFRPAPCSPAGTPWIP